MANISSINGNPIVLGQGAKNTVTDDFLADTGIKQVLGTMAVRPKLRNGSCRNPGNAYAVCVAKEIPTDGVEAVIVGLDFEEIEGYSYRMSYMEYNTYEDVDPAAPPATDIITNKDPYKICESKYEVINLGSRTKAIAVWFYAVPDNDPSNESSYPLRIADTGDAFVVYKMSVFMTREAFAYIGDGGKFTFKDDTIFDTSGRCGWRLKSPSEIIVKLPKSGTNVFSMEQVLDVLGDENTVTESGVKWAYIAAGKGLVYNSSSNKLMLRVINGTTPLDDDDYPLLLVWSSQMVGGMLYPKFLYDAANRLREQDASSGSDQFVSTSLVNSRHVPHRAGVTVASPLTLLHLSDIHGDSEALGRIMEDAARFSSLVNDSICTGDIVANTATEIASWWNGSVLTCIGNHDTASYDQSTGYDWTSLSMADRDSYYIKPFEKNWNIVHTSGTSYYYKDYSGSGIRLIVMDCMLYTYTRYATEANAQTAWLTSLLSDAIDNSLHVLIAIHAPHGALSQLPARLASMAKLLCQHTVIAIHRLLLLMRLRLPYRKD